MSHRSMRFVLRMCAVATALALSPVYASTITYSNLAAFQAAATIPASNDITFEGLAAANGQKLYNNSTGLIIGPTGDQVDFLGCSPACASATAYSLAVDNAAAGAWDFWGPGSSNSVLDLAGGASYFLQANLPANITAVGFDVMTAFTAGQSVSISVLTSAGSQTFTGIATQANPTEQFWGVTTDDPIINLQIQVPSGGNHVLIDNFQYGQSDSIEDTPEAITAILIGSGLLLLRGLKKFWPFPPA